MKARSALTLAAGLLAGMAVAPAGAQWVDPPAPGAAPPRAEAPAPKPPAAARAEPKVEPKPVEAAKAEPTPVAKPVQAATAEPKSPRKSVKAASNAQARSAGGSVETTGSIGTKRIDARKAAPPRVAKPARAATRTAERPAPRMAARPSRERFAPYPERARDLEMVRIRTIELPDGREIDVVTRVGRSRWD
jgi:outer membrane biosynthesis protein TonB